MPYKIDDETPEHLRAATATTEAIMDSLMRMNLCDGVIMFQFLRTKNGFQCVNSCRGVLPPNVIEFVTKAMNRMMEGQELTSLDKPN